MKIVWVVLPRYCLFVVGLANAGKYLPIIDLKHARRDGRAAERRRRRRKCTGVRTEERSDPDIGTLPAIPGPGRGTRAHTTHVFILHGI